MASRACAAESSRRVIAATELALDRFVIPEERDLPSRPKLGSMASMKSESLLHD